MSAEQKTNTGYSEEELFDMDDEELEAAFKEAQASIDDDDSIQDDSEENSVNDIEDDNSDEDDDDLEQPAEEHELDENDSDVNSDEDSVTDDSNGDNDSEKDSEDTEKEGTEDESDKTNNNGKPNEEVKSENDKLVIDLDEKRKFKAAGKDFEFTIQEMLDSYPTVFGQSVDYTKKTQGIKSHRELVDTAVAAKLSVDDLNLLADAINEKKPEAVAAIIKRAGVDPMELELEEAKEFVPTRYGRTADQITVDDVLESISADPEFAITENVIVKQWDDVSKEAMASNPNDIVGLHNDIKNGMFDIVSPRAMKLKVLDGGKRSDIEYYKAAGAQYLTEQRQQELVQQALAQKKEQQEKAVQIEANRLAKIKAEEVKRNERSVNSSKRKAAGTTRSRAGKKTATDYLEDSDEAFEEWYKKLEDNL